MARAPDLLAEAARAAPGAPAVLAQDGARTYRELDARATDLAERLAGGGMAPGARVATLLPATAEHVALAHALWRGGAVWVPLDPRLPGAEVGRRLAQTGATLLAPEDLDKAPARRLPARAPAGPAALVFTSGTSGGPRAAILTHENLQASARQVAARLRVAAADRWLAGVPLHHVGGIGVLLRCALARATAVVEPRFDAARANEAIDAGATLASLVPTMLQRLLDARGGRPFPPHLRAVLVGGDAAPAALLGEARRLRAPVLTTYGLTEAAAMVACPAPGESVAVGSAGMPLDGTRVAILDDRGRPSPPGEVGEIAVEGPTVFAGYDGDPTATARALRDGWLHTGDLGVLDARGALRVVGRADDRITTGGEKVDPAEVETALRAHPSVADAGVVGVPDAAWGQRVVAAVVPRGRLDEAALAAHCRSLLAPWKVPKAFVARAGLPRSEAGKLQRAALRAEMQG